MFKYINTRLICDFFLFGFATYGVIWLLAESFGAFFPDLQPEGIGWYTAIVSLSVVRGLWSCWPASRVEFDIPASDSVFEIKFGNILDEEDVIVIPVNEFFDGLLGNHVAVSSLHGQFIRDILDGESDTFVNSVNKNLQSTGAIGMHVQRPSGQCTKYAIGTVACVVIPPRRFLFAALTKTDLRSLKASATLIDLLECLTGIWKGVRDHSNGNPVKLPLIGSGLSGVGLPATFLVDMIVTSFVYATKNNKVTDKATLVLPPRLKGELDLKAIKRSYT